MSLVLGGVSRRGRKRSSPIYLHYDQVKGSDIIFTCKYCRDDVHKSKSGNTNLHSHMRTLHAEIYYKTTATQEEVNEKVARLIAMNSLPFRIVKSTEFQDLIMSLNPKVMPPSVHTVTELLPVLAEKSKEFFMEIIKDKSSWSATVDGWSSKHGRLSLFSITIRTIDKDWDIVSGVLAGKTLPGRHSSDRIAELIKTTVMNEVGCMPISLVTDNARSMIKTGEILETMWVGCGAHLINLITKNSIKGVPRVWEIVKACRKITDAISRSSASREHYEKCLYLQCIINQLPVLSIPTDIDIRWYTTVHMLKHLHKYRNPINDTLIHIGRQQMIISALDSEIILKVTKLLAPTEAVSLRLCRDESCASEIIPGILGIKTIVAREKESMDGIAAEFGDKLLTETETRWSNTIANSDVVAIMLCDARFAYEGKIVSDDDKEAKRIWKRAEKKVIEFYESIPDSMVIASPNIVSKPDLNTNTASVDVFACLFDTPPPTKRAKKSATNASIANDLAEYRVALARSRPPTSTLPTAFWKLNQFKYPALATCARYLLSAPSTSVKSEQLFSSATYITSNTRRGNLKSKNFESTLVWKGNATNERHSLAIRQKESVLELSEDEADVYDDLSDMDDDVEEMMDGEITTVMEEDPHSDWENETYEITTIGQTD